MLKISQSNLFLKWNHKFDYWNSLLIRCYKCRGDLQEVPKEYINNIVCESEYTCEKCSLVNNYWAYGSFEFPHTKTQTLRMFFITQFNRLFRRNKNVKN